MIEAELIKRAKECIIHANGDTELVDFYSDIIKYLKNNPLEKIKNNCSNQKYSCNTCKYLKNNVCQIADVFPSMWDVDFISEVTK